MNGRKERWALMVTMKKHMNNWDITKYVGEPVFVLGGRVWDTPKIYNYEINKLIKSTNIMVRNKKIGIS